MLSCYTHLLLSNELVLFLFEEVNRTMGDFPYIDHLARLYKQKGEESGNWTDYLKVN